MSGDTGLIGNPRSITKRMRQPTIPPAAHWPGPLSGHGPIGKELVFEEIGSGGEWIATTADQSLEPSRTAVNGRGCQGHLSSPL